MQNFLFTTIARIVFLLTLSAGHPGNVNADSDDAVLQVIVTDALGNPVKDASAWLNVNPYQDDSNSGAREYAQAASNEEGIIQMSIPKQWTSAVGDDGLVPFWVVTNGSLSGHQASLKHHIIAGRSFEIKVHDETFNPEQAAVWRVIDPAGKPIANAKVRPVAGYIGRTVTEIPFEVSRSLEKVTDKNGEAIFSSNTFSMTRMVEVTADKIGVQQVNCRFRRDFKADLALRDVGKVTGKIKNKDGSPVTGVELMLMTMQGPSDGYGTAKARSNDQGEFSAVIATGDLNVELVISKGVELVLNSPTKKIVEGKETTCNLVRSASLIRFFGIVLDSDSNEPVASTVLRLNYRGAFGFKNKTLTTDEQGRFEFFLPAGKAFVTVYGTKKHVYVGPEQTEVDIDANKAEIEFPIKLTRLVTVGGMVVDSKGDGVHEVRVFAKDGLRRYGHGITDKNGEFEIELPQGVIFTEYELWYGGTSQGRSTILNEEPLKLKIEELWVAGVSWID